MKIFVYGAILAASIFCSACTHLTSSHPLSAGTDWVANSRDWETEAIAVYQSASEYVRSEAAKRPAGTWAVVMDLDETVLNNVQYQIERERAGLEYSGPSWFAWTQKKKATLVPGAFEFIKLVNEQGGHVAFVTNRSDQEQLATEINLARQGIERSKKFRVLLTKALPKKESNKKPRFELVPSMLNVQGYPNVSIIAFVGDNNGDHPEDLGGAEFFCIDQGAMYGDPCAAVPRSGV